MAASSLFSLLPNHLTLEAETVGVLLSTSSNKASNSCRDIDFNMNESSCLSCFNGKVNFCDEIALGRIETEACGGSGELSMNKDPFIKRLLEVSWFLHDLSRAKKLILHQHDIQNRK